MGQYMPVSEKETEEMETSRGLGCRSSPRALHSAVPSRQRERNIFAARWPFRIASAARRDHDVLLAVDHVGGGRCVAGKGQRGLPQQLAGMAVEGMHLAVEDGCADEDDAARRNDRAAVVFRSRVLHALGG